MEGSAKENQWMKESILRSMIITLENYNAQMAVKFSMLISSACINDLQGNSVITFSSEWGIFVIDKLVCFYNSLWTRLFIFLTLGHWLTHYLMLTLIFLYASSISRILGKILVHYLIFVCSKSLMNSLNICCIYWFPRDFKLGGIIFVHRTVWCWVCTVGRVTACLMEVSVKTESASFCVFQMVFRWLIFLKDDMPSVSVPSLYVNSVFCPLKISVQWATVWCREALLPPGSKSVLGAHGHTPDLSGIFLTIYCTWRL